MTTMTMTGMAAAMAAPDTNGRSLDLELARRLAWHCAASYGEATITNAELDVQCDVVRDGSMLVLAFRGTEANRRDWQRNLEWKLTPFERGAPGLGRVHEGYHRGVSAIWEELSSYVSLAELEGRQLVLTGHSAGGAMAIDAAARLDRRTRPRVMTFGAPAMGDKAFAAAYPHHERTDRIEHDADIVPWVFAWPYRPVGHAWFLTDDGRVVGDPGRWFRLRRLLGKVGRRSEYISDHRIASYREALQRAVEVSR